MVQEHPALTSLFLHTAVNMAFVVTKKQQSVASENRNKPEDPEEEEEMEVNPGKVATHLYLKPAHSKGTLDREVVLRRIRHRKRVHNVKKAVQSLLISSPFASKKDDGAVSAPLLKWVDDAFAAL